MGIIAWYKLDGDPTDWHGDNDGTEVGTVTYPDRVIEEGMNVAGQANNKIDALTSSFTTMESFSIVCWLMIPASYTWNTGLNAPIIAAGSYAGGHGIIRHVGVDNRVSMYVRTTGGYGKYAYTSITRDVWAHIVGVYDAVEKELRIYHNGILIMTTDTSVEFPDEELEADTFELGGGTLLGGSNPTNRYFEGSLDDVRFYDHALSLKEAKKLYQAKTGHWKLNKDGTDCSGYHENGVVTDGVWSKDCKIGSHSWQKTADANIIVTTCYPNSQNTTYSFWFKHTSGTLSEGVIGHRNGSSGFMFYRNDANGDTQFQSIKYYTNTTPETLPLLQYNNWTINTWHYVICAYDENGNYKHFYDGVKTDYGTVALFDFWVDSVVPFVIGNGYNATSYDNYRGYIDDVKIFMTYLSDADCIALYKERASLDNEGNLHAQDFIINGVGEDITNIFKYEKWIPGTYTTTQTFNGGLPNSDMRIEAENYYTNYISNYNNPNGNMDIMLHTEILTPHLELYSSVPLIYDCNIDSTKTYRFSQWVYMHYETPNYRMRHYIGVESNTVCTVNTTILVSNPYMSYPYINDANFLDRWILQVYYIYPYGSTGNPEDSNRIYEVDGSNISYGREFNWADVVATHVRQYIMYQTSDAFGDYSAGNYIKTYRPRFEIVDGNEPPINDLLICGTHLPLLDEDDNWLTTNSLSKEGIYYLRGGDEVDLGIGDPRMRLTKNILYINGEFIEI